MICLTISLNLLRHAKVVNTGFARVPASRRCIGMSICVPRASARAISSIHVIPLVTESTGCNTNLRRKKYVLLMIVVGVCCSRVGVCVGSGPSLIE